MDLHTRRQTDASGSTAAERVPQARPERDRLEAAVQAYLQEHDLVPPLTLEEIRHHAGVIAQSCRVPESVDYVMVLLGSAVWRDTLADVPFERRILLLPQCLRSTQHCRADADAFGLLCARCGKCPIGAIEAEAEALGYMVLVAEGTTVVTQLLEQGRVDAVVGISCLDALERSFPHLSAEAIPGMAVALTTSGCVDTQVDLDRVRELLNLRSERAGPRLDLEALRREVDGWFTPDALGELLGTDGGHPGRLAVDWLSRSGKRWRPLLTAAVWKALVDCEGPVPDTVRRLAVAVECFHKASLIHDDIEDGDDERYDQPTLHAAEGVPIALNVGDLLVGEGYRLIASCGLDGARLGCALEVAAAGHRALAIGQGEELAWCRHPRPVGSEWVLDVFRMKTAPAFSVALRLGALCAESGEAEDALERFSTAMGVAYQIKDDLEDFRPAPAEDLLGERLRRPSIVTALAFGIADEHLQAGILDGWRHGRFDADTLARFAELAGDRRVLAKAELLLDHFRNEAVRALAPLRSPQLKTLLRRLTSNMVGNGARP